VWAGRWRDIVVYIPGDPPHAWILPQSGAFNPYLRLMEGDLIIAAVRSWRSEAGGGGQVLTLSGEVRRVLVPDEEEYRRFLHALETWSDPETLRRYAPWSANLALVEQGRRTLPTDME
jgi:hypothetical protein